MALKAVEKAIDNKQEVTIKPPNLQVATFKITGTAPYMQHRFSKKAEIMLKQQQGSTAQSKKKRAPRDFEKDYLEALYVSAEGWHGIPAAAFRKAMISACRLVNFTMTRAKLSVFILHDGIDEREGMPLVKITKGTPERNLAPVRLANGNVDIAVRPLWREWQATLRIRYDADQFTLEDVANLLERAGMQVGVGEGRPDSKDSAGIGYGTFTSVD